MRRGGARFNPIQGGEVEAGNRQSSPIQGGEVDWSTTRSKAARWWHLPQPDPRRRGWGGWVNRPPIQPDPRRRGWIGPQPDPRRRGCGAPPPGQVRRGGEGWAFRATNSTRSKAARLSWPATRSKAARLQHPSRSDPRRRGRDGWARTPPSNPIQGGVVRGGSPAWLGQGRGGVEIALRQDLRHQGARPHALRGAPWEDAPQTEMAWEPSTTMGIRWPVGGDGHLTPKPKLGTWEPLLRPGAGGVTHVGGALVVGGQSLTPRSAHHTFLFSFCGRRPPCVSVFLSTCRLRGWP